MRLSLWTFLKRPLGNLKADIRRVASVSTATADVDGHSAGDVVISLPPDVADILAQCVSQTDTCATSRKRTFLDCFTNIASGVLINAQPGQMLDKLLVLPTQMPQPAPQVIAQYLGLAIAAGQKIAFYAANSDVLNAVAELVVWFLYLDLIEHTFADTPTPTQFVIPASNLATTTKTVSSKSCALTGLEPCCPNRGRDIGNNTCMGYPDTNGFRAGCPCVGAGNPFQAYINNPQGFIDAQNLLAKLPDLPDAHFSCINGAAPPDPEASLIPTDYCQCGDIMRHFIRPPLDLLRAPSLRSLARPSSCRRGQHSLLMASLALIPARRLVQLTTKKQRKI